jgi:hypothetical protein
MGAVVEALDPGTSSLTEPFSIDGDATISARAAEEAGMSLNDPNMSDPRTPWFKRRVIQGGIVAVLVVAALMAFLAGEPHPQQGESLPNAAPQATEGMSR